MSLQLMHVVAQSEEGCKLAGNNDDETINYETSDVNSPNCILGKCIRINYINEISFPEFKSGIITWGAVILHLPNRSARILNNFQTSQQWVWDFITAPRKCLPYLFPCVHECKLRKLLIFLTVHMNECNLLYMPENRNLLENIHLC